MGCSSPQGCSLSLCLRLGTAAGDGDAAAPPADGAGVLGPAPGAAPLFHRLLRAPRPCPPWTAATLLPRGSALGAGPPCAPQPARQHPEAVRGLQQGRGNHQEQRPHCQPPPACPGSVEQQNHHEAESSSDYPSSPREACQSAWAGASCLRRGLSLQTSDTNTNDLLTWLNTADGTDTVPDILIAPTLPSSTSFPTSLSIVSGRVVPRSGEAGGKKAKHPVPASSPRMQETSPQDNMSPRKSKKMVVRWVAKYSKTLWEGKSERDSTVVGGSGQQAGSSKRRVSEDTNVPTMVLEHPGSLGMLEGKAPCACCPPCLLQIKEAWSMDPCDMQPQDRLLCKKFQAKTLQGLRMPRTDGMAYLLNSIRSFHPLGQRAKAVGLACQLPTWSPMPAPACPPGSPTPCQWP
ncbi:uncharacterized protein LOC142598328 [Balearica regulorum gibbericeps]|uniref:uncharacterized protein LOC142598328 n=1 Tax=Balearica regulorum gibbericeps TaxID=100784 RepID=UPI003F639157